MSEALTLDDRIDAIAQMRRRTWIARAAIYAGLATAVLWSVYVIVVADTDWARLAGASLA